MAEAEFRFRGRRINTIRGGWGEEMTRYREGRRWEGCRGKMRWYAIAVLLFAFSLPAQVLAFEIDSGNPDLKLRWENTLRYTVADRVKKQNPHILASPNNDDGDRNFKMGIVENRLDVLSEFDLIYKRLHGFRVSGAGWYDDAYRGQLDGSSLATSNHLDENGQPALGLSSYAKRFYRGPSGEILDAFVFTGFDVGAIPVNVKVGRVTLFWGEGLLLGGIIHGISYGQSSIDAQKAFAMPGTEAKELFRPRGQVNIQSQLTKTLSVSAQYFFEWEAAHLAEGGTYLGTSDPALFGGESLVIAPGVPGVRFGKGGFITPSNSGEWGVAARWSPEWLNGTLGAYYRKTSDILPQVIVSPATRSYFLNYGGDIDLLGVSLSKVILGISVGSELSYRWNMPLVSDTVSVVPGGPPGTIAALPGSGETGGARGNTWHGLVNLLGVLPRTMLFNGASWNTEFTWNRWDKVTQNPFVFRGRDSYTGIDKVSKDAFAVGLNFTPTWYEVLPGVSLSLPLSYSMGLGTNSAVTFGGNRGSGTYSGGLSADVYYTKYIFDLRYIGWFGDYATAANGSITVANGTNALLKDRNEVVFTAKTTF